MGTVQLLWHARTVHALHGTGVAFRQGNGFTSVWQLHGAGVSHPTHWRIHCRPLLGQPAIHRGWRTDHGTRSVPAVPQCLLFSGGGIGQIPDVLRTGTADFRKRFFKPNISTMVGRLYTPDDNRKDSAFTIFYMGVNVGSTLAPLVCGLVGNTGHPEDFKWGFLAACIGMILGATVFQIFKNKYICDPDGNPVGVAPQRSASTAQQSETSSQKSTSRTLLMLGSTLLLTLLFSINWNADSAHLFADADWIGSLIYATTIVMPVIIITDHSLSRHEKLRIGVIYIIAFFVIFFWAAYEQAGASLTFFADEQTDRHIGGWEMPAAYFQSFNPIMIVTLAPIFAAVWSFLGKRGIEPSSPRKQAIGLGLLALGYLFIAFGVKDIEPGVKVSMVWLTGLYLIHTMGELCLAPIGLSLVYKLSPARFSSLLMGVWYLSTSAANKFAGLLSGYYPEHGVSKSFMGYPIENLFDFFMLFVFMSGAAAVILFLLSGKLKKMMEV